MSQEASRAGLTRRTLFRSAAVMLGGLTASRLLPAEAASSPVTTLPLARPAAREVVRVGLLVPSSTLYPTLRQDFLAGFALPYSEVGGAGLESVVAESGVGPDWTMQSAQKLLEGEEVAVVVGMLNEEVAATLHPLFERHQRLLLVSNIGVNRIPVSEQQPSCFHHSLAAWQASYTLGQWAVREVGPRLFLASSFYDSGYDAPYAFRLGVEREGGSITDSAVSHMRPDEDGLTALMARIHESRPDAVYASYTGQNALAFLRAYEAAGLVGTVPLLGNAALVDETLLPLYGKAAMGIRSAASWAASLESEDVRAFTSDLAKTTSSAATAPAWLGYDTSCLLRRALEATGGTGEATSLRAALEQARPAQTLYLREVRSEAGGLVNRVVGTLADGNLPASFLTEEGSPRTGWLNTYLSA